MSSTNTVNPSMIQQWVAEKMDMDKVKEKLHTLGLDEESISETLKKFRKAKYAKRQVSGFIYLGVGAFLGFISCVLTIINPVPALYNWILYGLTSVSILLVILGLYYILE